MASLPRLSLAVIFVRDLDASVSFYGDVLGLTTVDRDPTAALLGSATRSTLILRSMGQDATSAPGSTGVQYVLWAADEEKDLDHAEQTLKARSSYVETRRSQEYAVVEGRDPDGLPVMIAYPGPDQLPLRTLPARIYAW